MTPEGRNAVDIQLLTEKLRTAVEELKESAERLEQAQQRAEVQIRELQRDVIHYKGIVGGAMFVLSGMWVAVLAFKDWIFNQR
jgi:hypothetical protein